MSRKEACSFSEKSCVYQKYLVLFQRSFVFLEESCVSEHKCCVLYAFVVFCVHLLRFVCICCVCLHRLTFGSLLGAESRARDRWPGPGAVCPGVMPMGYVKHGSSMIEVDASTLVALFARSEYTSFERIHICMIYIYIYIHII